MEFRPIDIIQPGQYYRLRDDAKGWRDEHITEDRMYLVIEYRHQTVKFIGIFPEAESHYGEELTWTSSEDEFFEDFEFSQEASDQRQKMLDEIVASAHEPLTMDQEVARELQALQSNPQALLEGPQGAKKATGDPGASESTDLACTPQERAALAQRDQLAKVKSLVQRKRNEIVQRNKRMQLAMQEKTALMKAKMEGLMVMVKSMEYMVHAMNVYLGIGEEFGIVFEGDRAPETEKLVVRQLVLFADEECTLFVEEGGIDFRNFKDFINWMKEDWSRVESMLPEPKGVVAIKMRRSKKHYSDDPMVNAAMNEENKKTWFLVRNGKNLFYIWPEFNVDERLFPTQRELDKIFMEDRLFGENERPIRPGEHRWVDAVDKADKKKKEMMVGLLFLQGLMDRTDVFLPFAGNVRPNLADPEEHDRFVRYLRDAEMLIHDGRPSWREYQRTINSRLRKGCRVIGRWPYNDKEETARCTPSYHSPNDQECYTITRQDADGHYFKFPIEYYSETQRGTAQRNISWQIKDYDHSCFINIDEVNEADLLYYMQDRVNRHQYLEMFPVIKRALNHLRREREDEKPFRMLIAGEVKKKHGIDILWDDSQMDKMLNWWKFKSRERRSIHLDDAKAVRMIVTRFGQWVKRDNRAASLRRDREAMVSAIKHQYPEVMFIGADDKGQVTAFVPRYDDRNVWYYQHFFKASDYSEKPVEPKLSADPWADTAYPTLYSNKRWESWEKWDRGFLTLTDEDQQEIVEWAQEHLPKVADDNRHRWNCHEVKWDDRRAGKRHPGACFRLIAAVQIGYQIRFWFQDHKFIELKGDHQGSGPTISRVKINWTRHGRTNKLKMELAEEYGYREVSYSRFSAEPGSEPWRGKNQFSSDGRVFWISKDNEDLWYQDYASWKALPSRDDHTRGRTMNNLIQNHGFDVRYTWICEYARVMRGKFMERAMGDADQCEEWLKKELERVGYSSKHRDMPTGPHLTYIPEAIGVLAQQGIEKDDDSFEAYVAFLKNLEGVREIKTLRELLAAAGYEIDEETFKVLEHKNGDEIPFLDVPLDWGDYSKYEPKKGITGENDDDDAGDDDEDS